MSERSAEDYEAEINRLKEELDALRQGRPAPTVLTGTVQVPAHASSHTVVGVEEMILQVTGDDEVGYVNAPMARLLDMPADKKLALDTPLSRWDRPEPFCGTLSSLVRVARATGDPYVLEREMRGLDAERLPRGKGEVPGEVAPILRFVATGVAGSVQIVVQDVTKVRWLERTFSRYVPPAVIERLQSMPQGRLLSMERREITILFADLRGFTKMTQKLEPEQVQRLVNAFLHTMVTCVERLGGTVDKFAGDEVMALFGAPIEQPDHALRALVCAAEMIREHARWEEEQQQQGRPHASVGIGLATGEVVVGNIGTEGRMEYTALGHPVNLAARLVGTAAGGDILTIPDTHRAALASLSDYEGEVAVPRFSFRSQGNVSFKNVDDPVEVVKVIFS